ncbi:MAG TPA: Hsp20/alpha crystallin family protein [Caulobacteraceae bacterium]|jgi:HSP20 family protein
MRTELIPFQSGETERSFAPPSLLALRQMSRIFDDVLLGAVGAGVATPAVTLPRIDISETDKQLKIAADLPGVEAKDVQVTLDDDLLTIRGETSQERKEDGDSYHVVERARGAFQRSIRLPAHVNPEQVEASFQNGVLTISIPKPAEQPSRRQIPIREGKTDGSSETAAHGSASGAGAAAEAQAAKSQPAGAQSGEQRSGSQQQPAAS